MVFGVAELVCPASQGPSKSDTVTCRKGEGGCGKTYAVNKTIGAAHRLFLHGLSNFHPIAYTNRAAGQLGPGADTIAGYGEQRPERKAPRSPCLDPSLSLGLLFSLSHSPFFFPPFFSN